MARNLLGLNEFVNDYYLGRTEEDLDKNHDEQQIRLAAMRTFRDLQLDSFKSIVSVRLNVNTSLYTVDLPADYVRYTKIGILGNDGSVHSVSLNPDMNIAGDILLGGSGDEILDSEGFPTTSDRITDFGGSTQDTTQPFGYLFGNYNYNGFYGRLFGYGGGNNINGYYRFSNEDNKIYMNVDFGYDKIILEYISDQSMANNPNIPVECEQAMYSGTYFHLIKRMGRPVSQGDKEQARRDYLNDKRIAKARRNQPTRNEIVSNIYKQFTLSPRITS
jgi:hypothetical protein